MIASYAKDEIVFFVLINPRDHGWQDYLVRRRKEEEESIERSSLALHPLTAALNYWAYTLARAN